MKKKIISALIILCALNSACFGADVSAESAIAIDADSGRVLFEKNADERRLIASTTKIMTALVALETLDRDARVRVPEEAALVGGSSMYLRAGEDVSVRELLYGLLLESGNDAAVTLASACGNADEFVKKMNEKAASLGLSDTHFTNPHGLDDREHYSTARDLAHLASCALDNEDFASICACKSASVCGRTITNHNKLLSLYEGVIGVKTGFTQKAGRCLVSAAQRNGRRVVCVTLCAPDDWNDHIKLYDAVFSSLHRVKIAAQGDCAAEIPLAGGGFVRLQYLQDLEAELLGDEEAALRLVIEAPKFYYEKPPKYEIAGFAKLFSGGKLIASAELGAL